MSENRWWVDNETIMDFRCTRDRFSITDTENVTVLDLKLYENLVEVSGSMHLVEDVIEFSKDKMKFRNSQNTFTNNIFRGITNAIVIKEASFAKPILGAIGVLIEV